MKIIDNTESKTIPFKNIKLGDTFKFRDNNIYMKTVKMTKCNSNQSFNAVCLDSGGLFYFNHDTQILPVETRLFVTDKKEKEDRK